MRIQGFVSEKAQMKPHVLPCLEGASRLQTIFPKTIPSVNISILNLIGDQSEFELNAFVALRDLSVMGPPILTLKCINFQKLMNSNILFG